MPTRICIETAGLPPLDSPLPGAVVAPAAPEPEPEPEPELIQETGPIPAVTGLVRQLTAWLNLYGCLPLETDDQDHVSLRLWRHADGRLSVEVCA